MRKFLRFVWHDLGLKWLVAYLIASLVIWGALAVFDAQGIVNQAMEATWALLKWMLQLPAPAFFHDWVLDWCNRLPLRLNIAGQDNQDGDVFTVWLFWADLATNLWFLFVLGWVVVWIFKSLFGGRRSTTTHTTGTTTATTATTAGGATATTVTNNFPAMNEYQMWWNILKWPVGLVITGLAISWVVLDLIMNKVIPRGADLMNDPSSRPEPEPSFFDKLIGLAGNALLIAMVGVAIMVAIWATSRFQRAGRGGDPWTGQDTLFLGGAIGTMVTVVFATMAFIHFT